MVHVANIDFGAMAVRLLKRTSLEAHRREADGLADAFGQILLVKLGVAAFGVWSCKKQFDCSRSVST